MVCAWLFWVAEKLAAALVYALLGHCCRSCQLSPDRATIVSEEHAEKMEGDVRFLESLRRLQLKSANCLSVKVLTAPDETPRSWDKADKMLH